MIHGLLAAALILTFHKDVEPILQQHCQECHRPGEVAPMSLLTYKDARPWAAAIKQAVLTQKMPPWHAADVPHQKFLNDRRLSQTEINTLVTWVQTGATEGDPKDSPAPRSFPSEWSIGKPDVVIDMGSAYKVPATGTIDYTFFTVPTNFKEDKWVEKIEVRPGARAVVHHIVLYARAPGSKAFEGAMPGAVFVEPKDSDNTHKPDIGEGQFYGLSEGGNVEMVGVYVPGGDAYVTRPGQARLIKAGSDFDFPNALHL